MRKNSWYDLRGFSPVWVRWWIFAVSCRANDLSQIPHAYGRSPVSEEFGKNQSMHKLQEYFYFIDMTYAFFYELQVYLILQTLFHSFQHHNGKVYRQYVFWNSIQIFNLKTSDHNNTCKNIPTSNESQRIHFERILYGKLDTRRVAHQYVPERKFEIHGLNRFSTKKISIAPLNYLMFYNKLYDRYVFVCSKNLTKRIDKAMKFWL